MRDARATALLSELDQLAASGGARDDASLRHFGGIVASLRALPGATSDFQMRAASAAGWAALLYSSWRHRKYDQPGVSGAERVRAFLRRDLALARSHAPGPAAADAAPTPSEEHA